MSNVFRAEYKQLSDEQKAQMADIKEKAAVLLESFGEAKSREMSLAITKLEEAVMWAVKGVTA